MSFTANHRWLLIVPLLLLVVWLGARGLNSNSFWYDEWWSLYDAGATTYGPLSPVGILQRIATQDPYQSPGYYLALSAWGSLVGWTEYGGRSLSVLTGILAVAVTYRLGKTLTGKTGVGLGAAVALGTGAFFVHYLHEMRGYTLFALLSALCVWFYWRLIRGRAGLLSQAGFVLSIAGLLYVHYFAGITVLGIAVYHLLFVPGKKAFPRGTWWRAVWLMILGGLSFLPWCWIALQGLARTRSESRYLTGVDTMLSDILVLFSSAGASLLLVLAISTLRRPSQALALVWVWVITWCVAAPIASYVAKTYSPSYWMGVWPALALLVGFAVQSSGLSPALLIGVWLGFSLWMIGDPSFNARIQWIHWHQPLRELASALAGRTRSGDLVTYHLTDDVSQWMLQNPVSYYLRQMPIRVEVVQSVTGESDTGYEAQAARLVQPDNVKRVWVTDHKFWQPQRLPKFEQVLERSGFQRCFGLPYEPQVDVWLYVRLPKTPPVAELSFNDQISARLVETPTVTTNDDPALPVLPVVLEWSVSDQVPPNTYSVALHVQDEAGNLYAQTDYGLLNGCQAADVVLKNVPPGEYNLWLVVYKWQTAERLGRLSLGKFTVPGNDSK